MNKAFKFSLKPNKEQEVLIQKTFGCCRFIYNKMLEDKLNAYAKDKITLKNTPAQYKNEFPWLKEIDSYALCNEQLKLQAAYKQFVREPKRGLPRYKTKKKSKKSYTTSNVRDFIQIREGRLIHLNKLGWVKIVLHRQIPRDYKIKSATISQSSSGKYWVSILTEYHKECAETVLDKNNSIGLDYSSHDFYVDSEGHKANYPKFYRMYQEKLAVAQRKLSHMKFNSSNYQKQKIKVTKIHEKIANSRKDFCHKLSFELSNKYDYIFIEDIDLRNIAKSLKLGKATLDNGFGMFRTYLRYKMKDRGKELIKIGRFKPTSIVCNNCGAYHKDIVNSLSVREWVCPDCNTHHDRDVNAAKNIKKIGLSLV